MRKELSENRKSIWDTIIFICVGIFSLGYSVYGRQLAEIHITLPFLDFPVFIGEMLLGACILLLTVKWFKEGKKFNKNYLIIGLFFIWIFCKAIKGYREFGPLSFRHAALFYYTFFMILGYQVFNKNLFSQKLTYLYAAALLILIFIFKNFGYYTLIYFLIGLVLFNHIKNVKLKWGFLLGLMILFPVNNFFRGGRSYFVGTCTVFVYLYFYFVFFALSRKRNLQIFVSILSLCAFFLGVKFFANKNKIETLLNFKKVITRYQNAESNLEEPLKHYTEKIITPELYHPETKNLMEQIQSDPRDRYFDEEFLKKLEDIKLELLNTQTNPSIKKQHGEKLNEEFDVLKENLSEIAKDLTNQTKIKGGKHSEEILSKGQEKSSQVFQEVKVHISDIISDDLKSNHEQAAVLGNISNLNQRFDALLTQAVANRDISVEYDNMIFRIYIWRDMMEDLIQKQAWLGVSFGMPQRSKRIEITGLAYGEWSRDGWITPHNSWLHYLYRGGIVGFGFIVTMFILFIRSVKQFILIHNSIGILLCAIILYWFTIANFLIIFEVPYNAIPVWTLFGMILAYSRDLQYQKPL